MNTTTSPTATAAAGSPPAQARAARGRLMIDAPMRAFHWLFALSFVGAYLTADGERWRALHVTLGYTFAALAALRVLYGLAGPRQARLALLWRKLGGFGDWLRSLRSLPQAPAGVDWRRGQVLLGGLAVLLVLALVLPLTLSGYAVYDDWVAGGLAEALEEVHETLGNLVLTVVLVHLGALLVGSLMRRRNLATPMLTGRLPGPGPDVVRHERRAWAAALLLAVLAFGAWQWQQSPAGLWPTAPTGHGLEAQGSDLGDDDDDDDDHADRRAPPVAPPARAAGIG